MSVRLTNLYNAGAILFAFGPLLAFSAPAAQFEVASVKRNTTNARPFWGPPSGDRFTATNAIPKAMIALAFGVSNFQIVGGPNWIDTDGYDFSVKALSPITQLAPVMQSVLANRFALTVHKEMREQPVYILGAAKSTLHLPDESAQPCVTGIKPTGDAVGCGAMNVTPTSITNDEISMPSFVGVLTGVLNRPVIDNTGFGGSFKAHLEFAPLNNADPADLRPSLFAALQEQLGLSLHSQKAPANVLVIDHIERPTEN